MPQQSQAQVNSYQMQQNQSQMRGGPSNTQSMTNSQSNQLPELPVNGRVLAKAALAPAIPARIEKGKLSISIDAGLNWQQIKTPDDVVSARFLDPLNGEIDTKSKRRYRTNDGGKTWTEIKDASKNGAPRD